MTSGDEHPLITALVGDSLSAVTFVMDYVQLGFQGAMVTAYTLPTVEMGGHRWSISDSGWRDALCDRIGLRVRGATTSSAAFVITFEDDSAISISLRTDDYRGPEAFTLSVAGRTGTLVG